MIQKKKVKQTSTGKKSGTQKGKKLKSNEGLSKRKIKTSKKTVNLKKKTSLPKKNEKKEKLAGRVTHYFNKAKVIVVKLSTPLAVEDKIRIKGGNIDFEQKVKSIEIEGKKIKRGKAKEDVGIKVAKKTKEGCRVFKIL